MEQFNKYECNVQNIKINPDTKAIITIKAKLNDIFEALCDITQERFSNKKLTEVEKVCTEMDNILMGLLTISIDCNLAESDYAEM